MNVNTILMLIASAVTAFVAVNWVYFKILKIAKDKGLVDNPDARKLQKQPVPVMGGIAVFMGVAAGIIMASALTGPMLGVERTDYLIPVLMAMVVMLYTGAMDDIVGLSPNSRLVIEILAVLGLIYGSGSCVDSLHGVFGVYEYSWWVGVPLTVFAGVGIINAVNMVDGVNGLSSGLCMAVASLFGIAFVKSGDWSNAVLAFIMAASLLPFYFHNVFGNSSRMFIGDAGTMAMGILMTWFMMSVLRSDSPVVYYSEATGVGLVAMTVAFLCVPVADTLRVMTMRVVHGRSPFSPDKTHLHHVFISVGVSHFITSSTEIVINLTVASSWALSVVLGASVTVQLLVVIGMSMLLVWGTYIFIRYNEIHYTPFMHWLSHVSVATHFGNKHWWKSFAAWLDKPEIKNYGVLNADRLAYLELKFNHPENYKEEDRKKIFDYIKGKAEVHVQDIINHSGAEKLRVYTIIYEMESEGEIEVIKRGGFGDPQIIALK